MLQSKSKAVGKRGGGACQAAIFDMAKGNLPSGETIFPTRTASPPVFKYLNEDFCDLFHQRIRSRRHVRGDVAPHKSQWHPRRTFFLFVTAHRGRRKRTFGAQHFDDVMIPDGVRIGPFSI